MLRKMTKLGTKKKPLMLRVRSFKRVQEVTEHCDRLNAQYILEIAEDRPEDLTDLDRYLRRSTANSFWTLRRRPVGQ